jgi:uncharacterized membrane protein YjjB (DUF3815 family)
MMQLNRSTKSALKLGAAIGLLNVLIASIYISNRPIGASTSYPYITGWLFDLKDSVYFKSIDVPGSWEMWFIFGGFIGSLCIAVWTKKFKISFVPKLWGQYKGHSSVKRMTWSFIGGFILILGARIADGCASGHIAPDVAGQSLPLALDMLAASVAIAAFGTFFAMPWRVLMIPMAIGAVAHAIRWGVIEVSHDVVIGAAAACFFAGIVATPLAHKLKLPFAALAFVSVVSMMPGVFLFRMSSALVEIYKLGGKSTESILGYAASDAMTTVMICLAIAFGLIIPKLMIDHYFYERA